MDDEDEEVDAGWEAAQEHGGHLAEWILDQDNYSHPEFAGRDIDGRFNKRLGSRELREED